MKLFQVILSAIDHKGGEEGSFPFTCHVLQKISRSGSLTTPTTRPTTKITTGNLKADATANTNLFDPLLILALKMTDMKPPILPEDPK